MQQNANIYKNTTIPFGWSDCPNIAKKLIAGKFIVFKTPLNTKYDAIISAQNRFPVETVFHVCRDMKIDLGLWVDLTNTSRFYNSDYVDRNGCNYYKLECSLYKQCPNRGMVTKFNSRIQEFIRKNPTKCIGVHCSLGLNVTGFMIVSYLVMEGHYHLEDALDLFTTVRPPGIYLSDFLVQLYKNFDDIKNVRKPIPPVWSSGISVMANDYEDNLTDKMKNMNMMEKTKKVTFMNGIQGVVEFTEKPKVTEIRQKVHKFCGWIHNGFPGTYPVNISKTNMEYLNKEVYNVTSKCIGNRYMLLIDGKDECYFFDVNYNVFHAPGIRFPKQTNPNSHLKNTLIDGVMILNKDNAPTYFIYDIIYLNGKDVGKEKLCPTRLQLINDEVIEPRNKLIQTLEINVANELFGIQKKSYFDIEQTKCLLSDTYQSTLQFETEGIVFISNKPYVFGRNDESFKWRSTEDIQIKFKLKLITTLIGGKSCKAGELYVGKHKKPFAMIQYTDELKDLNGKIISCNLIENQWRFVKLREDRAFPNSISTATSVCGSIQDNITKEKLLEYIKSKAKTL